MPRYIRAYIPGASYFFTVTIRDRRRHLLIENINILRSAFRAVRRVRPFRIDAIVVLPDHLHCIWTLPQGDSYFSTRWRLIKTKFTQYLPQDEQLHLPSLRKGERGIWQRRFWEHVIRDEEDFAAHVDYIHYNPVRHGWAERVADWPYSSFHGYVRVGIYPRHWAAVEQNMALERE